MQHPADAPSSTTRSTLPAFLVPVEVQQDCFSRRFLGSGPSLGRTTGDDRDGIVTLLYSPTECVASLLQLSPLGLVKDKRMTPYLEVDSAGRFPLTYNEFGVNAPLTGAVLLNWTSLQTSFVDPNHAGNALSGIFQLVHHWFGTSLVQGISRIQGQRSTRVRRGPLWNLCHGSHS